jgi:cell division protein FtsZ
MGALTVGVVTKPFMFEGKKRMKYADMGIQALEECVDSLITIPNQRLLSIAGENLSLVETFKRADEVLLNAVQGISDLINNTGLINADFADVSTVMSNKGLALMGTGVATGPERAIKAATLAISSPLLEDITIDGATGIIINITGNSSLTAYETNEAVSLIMEAADEDAEIIFGTVIDENMNDELKVTVIATGLADRAMREVMPSMKSPMAIDNNTKLESSLSYQAADSIMPEPEVHVEAKKLESDLDQANQNYFSRPASNLSESIKEAASRYEAKKQKLDTEIKWDLGSTSSVKEEEPAVINKSKTKSLAEKLGFINFDDDEFDTPTFLRQKGPEATNNENLDN